MRRNATDLRLIYLDGCSDRTRHGQRSTAVPTRRNVRMQPWEWKVRTNKRLLVTEGTSIVTVAVSASNPHRFLYGTGRTATRPTMIMVCYRKDMRPVSAAVRGRRWTHWDAHRPRWCLRRRDVTRDCLCHYGESYSKQPVTRHEARQVKRNDWRTLQFTTYLSLSCVMRRGGRSIGMINSFSENTRLAVEAD